MEGSKVRIGITIGDPAGIGPEVTLKAVNSLNNEHIIPLIIARREVLERFYSTQLRGYDIIGPGPVSAADLSPGKKYIYHVMSGLPLPAPGMGSVQTGRESLGYIDAALELWKSKVIGAIVTGPVSKGLIETSGCPFTGHTEYLAAKLDEPHSYMMMFSPEYRVLLVTTHLPIAEVARSIDIEKIVRTIRVGLRAMVSIDGGEIKIAVTGLDPHCGDRGAIGRFDERVTARAVQEARREGIPVDGPFSADTLFLPDRWKKYNLVIAHYHDQGLIPFKMLAFDMGVNVTLGMSLTRTSVDHGTAFDIAGKNKAGFTSMAEAIRLAWKIESQRGI